jgi:hypothetical protein
MVRKIFLLFPTFLFFTPLIFSSGFNIPPPIFTPPQQNSFTQPKQQVQSLSHFLQSKYLGITIDYYDLTEDVVLDEEFNLKQGDVLEILTNKNGHYLVLEGDIRVRIDYSVSQSGDPNFVGQMNGTDTQSLQLQVLETQSFINQSIASIGNDQASDASSSVLSSAQAANSAQTSSPVFTSSEEIIYTDLRDNRKKKSGAIANLDGVFLVDGAPVIFKFVRDKL